MRWFRERAAVDRLQEELDILEEEFRRTHTTFLRMNKTWEQLAAVAEKTGHACYARRQAKMFHLLAEDCETAWKEEI